ncbi:MULTISPECIES: MFS transporter [unclassified Streptomyces]|uniref:MFS transporter n=1 Tax=unclassified Streptomyces TaxID=2593676 RepID=UPI002259A3EA|nr:MFS transporter [Streptomyces sp. NBC_00160]MCX5304614.1 MFS transporter [Streptomyces sp. NBC_00160]
MPNRTDRAASPAGAAISSPPRSGIGAAVVAFAFWITMAGTTAPTPLYPLYGKAFGFSPITVTVIFAVYALGVVAGLLAFGRLSDQIGRRPVLVAATLLSVCAALVFLAAGNVAVLLVARVVSGFSAALVTGAATASLAELIPQGRRVRPATVALFANMGGLACGTLLAGILADAAPSPLRTPWIVMLVLAAVGLVGVAASRETATHRSGFTFRLQPLHIPSEIRSDFLRSAMAAGAGFSVLGVLTAVTGLFLGTVLHKTSHSLTGLVVFTAFACTALGQLLVRRIRPGSALSVACLGLILAAALIALAMAITSLVPLLIGAAVNGLATGIAISHGIGGITTHGDPQHRGASVSTFFAILYSMLAVPAIGVGVLIRATSLRPAGEIFSALVALLALTVLLSLARSGVPESRHSYESKR